MMPLLITPQSSLLKRRPATWHVCVAKQGGPPDLGRYILRLWVMESRDCLWIPTGSITGATALLCGTQSSARVAFALLVTFLRNVGTSNCGEGRGRGHERLK